MKEPIAEEYGRLREDLTLFTYLHIAADEPLTDALLASGITGIAYETVETSNRHLPLLAPMSEVAGRLAPQMGAWSLEKAHGGRGILLRAGGRNDGERQNGGDRSGKRAVERRLHGQTSDEMGSGTAAGGRTLAESPSLEPCRNGAPGAR